MIYYYDEQNKLIKISKEVANNSKEIAIFQYNKNILEYAIDAEGKTALKFEYLRLGKEYKVNKVCTGAIASLANISMPTEYVKAHTSLLYTTNSTTIVNEKSLKIVYFLNEKGFTTSIFEDVGNQDYRTLFKTNGWELMDGNQGDENVRINGKKAKQLSSNTYVVDSNKITDF